VTIAVAPETLYRLWRNFENLPRFMSHLERVRVIDDRRSHWTVKTAPGVPDAARLAWDAEIVNDRRGDVIAWRSLDGSDIGNEGEVRFVPAPGGRGTEVHVAMRYTMPGGKLGKAVARYFGEDPHQALDDDLRRFKQVAETGEVVRSEGAPGGKHARQEFPQHPARPLTPRELEEVRS
jgi:uncharacterized membrane protein